MKMNNNKEKLQPTKLYLNKEEYNKLYEVLALNERRNDEVKSSKATELKEKLVKYASVLDKREQDTEERAVISLFPIEIKFLIDQLLDFVNNTLFTITIYLQFILYNNLKDLHINERFA